MAKWGSPFWGDFTWGAVDPTVVGFWVDWFDDGNWGQGESNADRIIEFEMETGRDNKMAPSGDGFEYADIGKMRIVLDNRDRRYDPFYSSSPYYNYIIPGREFRLAGSAPASQDGFELMRGIITDIKPAAGNNSYVVIEGEDRLALLRDHTYYSNLVEGDTVTDLIEDILTDAGFTSANWSLDTDATDIVPYYWCDGKSALSAIHDLIAPFAGNFYVNGSGVFQYHKYLHVYAQAGTVTESKVAKPIIIRQPWEYVKNYIQVNAHTQVEAGSATVLWKANDIPYVNASSSITVWGQNTTDGVVVPDGDPVTMVSGTDFIANSQEDGGGSNLTSSISVVETVFATTRKMVITNSGGTKAYLTTLQYRGKAITTRITKLIEEDSASQTKYGVRKFVLNFFWMQNTNVGIALAQLLKTNYAEAEKFPITTFEHQSISFDLQLFTLWALYFPSIDITDNYMVAHVKHHYKAGDKLITTVVWELGVDISEEIWRFPADIGETTRFG